MRIASFRRRKNSGRSPRDPRPSVSSRIICSNVLAMQCSSNWTSSASKHTSMNWPRRFPRAFSPKSASILNSILDEAVELEFIAKNPAAKLAVPRSGKKVTGVHLTPEQIPVILFNLSDRDRLIVRMFLVLGLRPGELFALRWNDKAPNSLRIDSSITDGIEVETKTEGSNANVWVPVSIDTELEWWRSSSQEASPDAFIFPSARGTAINTNNFLFRVLKEAGKKAEILGVTHQM